MTKAEVVTAMTTKRKALDMTQVEVADLLRVSVRTLSRWENGETKPRGRDLTEVRGFVSRDKPEESVLAMNTHLERALLHLTNVNDPHWDCWDCKQRTDPYMVQDDVWLEAWPDYMVWREHLTSLLRTKDKPNNPLRLVLCFDCLERRLGRKLVIYDLTSAPINRLLKKGAEMGLAELQKLRKED